ncbi:MAG: glycerophosphodiester phosphodiesterase family protein [Pseudomonadota bacterium]
MASRQMIRLSAVVGLALACTACAEPAVSTPNEIVDFGLDGPETAASFLSCLEGKAAIVSAHRGGPSAGYPENAIETFLHVLGQVPALLEVDVRETGDGALVLMHDETVDRTTNGTGAVADMTLAELKALRLVDNDGRLTDFQVPTLGEALTAIGGRTILQLDVKRGVGLRQVVHAVEDAGAEAYAGIITYTDGGAAIVAETSDDIAIFATVDTARHLDRLAQEGVDADRLVAWTGIIEGRPRAGLYRVLGERGISASGGALSQLDHRAARGAQDVYRELEEAGLDIIATDRPIAAAREIGTEDVVLAARSCAG